MQGELSGGVRVGGGQGRHRRPAGGEAQSKRWRTASKTQRQGLHGDVTAVRRRHVGVGARQVLDLAGVGGRGAERNGNNESNNRKVHF